MGTSMAWLDVTPTDYRNYAAPSRPRSVFGQLSFVDGLVDLGLQLLFFCGQERFSQNLLQAFEISAHRKKLIDRHHGKL